MQTEKEVGGGLGGGGEKEPRKQKKIMINPCPDGFYSSVGHCCLTVRVSAKEKKKKTIRNDQVVVLIISRLFDESETKGTRVQSKMFVKV